jgi:prepilin-type N-terminal cleavage/methylation domain-containing protein
MTTLAPTFPPASIRRHAFNEDGFTMIEMLTVIAIIGILTAIAVPALFDIKAKWENEEAVGQSARQVKEKVEQWKSNHGAMEVPAELANSVVLPENVHITVVQKHSLVNGVDLPGDYQVHGWADAGKYTESSPYILDPLENSANTAPST